MTAATRAERSALNKAAHAIRRRLTDEDYREAKAAGLALSWAAIGEAYAAMPAAVVVATFGDQAAATTAPVAPVTGDDETAAARTSKRDAPVHVREAQALYSEARAAWESGLEAAMGSAYGKSFTRAQRHGEKYIDEERDYRDAHPAPLFADFLRAVCAERRAMAAAGGAA